MTRVFVYGVTAVGKSTWSKALSQQRNLQYIDGDYIRLYDYIPSLAGHGDSYIHANTKTAWKRFGLRTPAHIRKGLVALREGVNDYIDEKLEGEDDFVFDASYVDPNRHKDSAEVYLLVCLDSEEHRRRMFERDTANGRKSNEVRFADARALQEVLVREAKHLGIKVVDLSTAKITAQ